MNGMKIKIILFIVSVLLLACHKDKPITVDLNLTGCPINNSCTYNYYDDADFSTTNPLTQGNYRVFWYSRSNDNVCGPASHFYLKAAVNNADFIISSNQLTSAQVFTGYNDSCPCCARATVLSTIIDGEIKGHRIDAQHWLINARIIFGVSAGHPIDSIKVNQYFTLAKLP